MPVLLLADAHGFRFKYFVYTVSLPMKERGVLLLLSFIEQICKIMNWRICNLFLLQDIYKFRSLCAKRHNKLVMKVTVAYCKRRIHPPDISHDIPPVDALPSTRSVRESVEHWPIVLIGTCKICTLS